MTLNEFLTNNKISTAEWNESNCEWEVLARIAEDHDQQRDQLKESAEFFAKVVQKIPGVHSVRWRVKETAHLLEKIVRKCIDKQEKYADIGVSNYHEIVTDLIGLRALHLFKDDCLDIHDVLVQNWEPVEQPIAYVRQGDDLELAHQFEELGFSIKEHPAGYRSVHYVFSTKPLQRTVVVELQVRTIFEEGWSEIDHKIRYPRFSDNALVSYFLGIFNRMAGSADEMGSFVKGLASQLEELKEQLAAATTEKEQTLLAMEETVATLAQLKQQDEHSQKALNKLKEELALLKGNKEVENSSVSNILGLILDGIAKNGINSVSKPGATSLQDYYKKAPLNKLAQIKPIPTNNSGKKE